MTSRNNQISSGTNGTPGRSHQTTYQSKSEEYRTDPNQLLGLNKTTRQLYNQIVDQSVYIRDDLPINITSMEGWE